MISSTNAAVMALASALSLPAAADPGWYGFGAFGRSSFEIEGGAGAALAGGDDKDNGSRLGAGYMFTRNFGVEAGWVDFGKAKRGGALPGLSTAREGEVRANGPFFAGVASVPLSERFSAFGKLGVIDARIDASGDSDMTSFMETAEWRPLVGIGGAYQVSRNWAIQTEYGKYSKTGDKDRTGEVRVSMISIGMLYRLG
jgi:OOP family OmpA-OmpF porin